MITSILAAIAIVSSLGWLKNRIGLLTICYYMQVKNYTPPSDAEMKACSEQVIKHLLKK